MMGLQASGRAKLLGSKQEGHGQFMGGAVQKGIAQAAPGGLLRARRACSRPFGAPWAPPRTPRRRPCVPREAPGRCQTLLCV